MKKSFPLHDPHGRHEPPRYVEQIKSEIRKYLKRENRKSLPEEFDFWDFDCRTGKDPATATKAHVQEIIPAIDKAMTENWPQIYLEILAKPVKRQKRAPK